MDSISRLGFYRRGLCMVITFLLLFILPAAGAPGNGASYDPAISTDGRYVTFLSGSTNLVAGDINGVWDIFVRDRNTGTNYLVSKSSGGVLGDGDSHSPSVSSDGRYLAFESDATNLVAGDSNGKRDVFVRDRQTGTTSRVSRSSAGVQENDHSNAPSISADGRYVVFESDATNLVAGDSNGMSDVFVRDRQTGSTSRVSRSSAGIEGNGNSYDSSLSADGRYVTFNSDATNLVTGDTNIAADIFVRDRQTGTTTLVSRTSAGVVGDGSSYGPSISGNGRYVVFDSLATNLAAGDTNGYRDTFVRDRQTGTTTLVSKNSAGAEGNLPSYEPAITSDGRYVVFQSDATNLAAGDSNAVSDIFVRDRQTGTTTLVSKDSAGVEGNGGSNSASISDDGRYVLFASDATNLVADDTNGYRDIFVRDRQTGTTTLVSKS
jgi:Tol biopolymer transport system component